MQKFFVLEKTLFNIVSGIYFPVLTNPSIYKVSLPRDFGFLCTHTSSYINLILFYPSFLPNWASKHWLIILPYQKMCTLLAGLMKIAKAC